MSDFPTTSSHLVHSRMTSRVEPLPSSSQIAGPQDPSMIVYYLCYFQATVCWEIGGPHDMMAERKLHSFQENSLMWGLTETWPLHFLLFSLSWSELRTSFIRERHLGYQGPRALFLSGIFSVKGVPNWVSHSLKTAHMQ